MLKLQFDKENVRPLKVLCIGAHSDDIEIGCGGAILRLVDENPDTTISWVVFSADREREAEAVKSANIFLAGVEHKRIVVKNFRDSFFPYIGGEIKQYFETLKHEVKPDVIFTHYRHDLHQDHRLLCELTWNTYRNHLILEYETVKYDGDLGAPNFFVPLNEETCRKKVDTIFSCFKTQGSRSWFTEDVFFSIMRIRGVECNAQDKYAEGFYCRKMIL